MRFPPFVTKPGQMLMLAEAVGEFPRGTPVKVLSVDGNPKDPTVVVEPYRHVGAGPGSGYAPAGAPLTVEDKVLAQSLPEFRSGITLG